MYIKIITLGCSKNSVDSEVILGNLKHRGIQVLKEDDKRSPDILIINTCGFIHDAKQESIDMILDAVELKRQKQISEIWVMGCLIQRYKEELSTEIPEVDAWFGVNDSSEIVDLISKKQYGKLISERVLQTPPHYAYLKIAEGCNRRCSFCAIPLIRGNHISRPIEDVVEEAKMLAKSGVKELILISQDVSFYGLDLYKKRRIAELCEALAKVEGIEWIRLQYLYPHEFPEDLLDVMAQNSKICNYIDIPLQHINTKILKSMKRSTTKEETLELMQKMRTKLPNAAFRTTFIVGYPGETKADFEELVDFVKAMRFERVGVFTYSEEEGTSAAELKDNVSEKQKQERLEKLMEIQQDISAELNQQKIGNTYKVLIDREEAGFYIGRTEFDSPEVDNEVLIPVKNKKMKIGNFYDVEITDADAFDLFG